MSDIKAKLLKVANENKEWEKAKSLLVEKTNVLHERKLALEKRKR